MEFHESDYVDDSFLEEIQCDKCPYSFPLYLFSEHELMCHPLEVVTLSSSDTEDEESEIAEVKIEKSIPQALEENVKAPRAEKNFENLIQENLLALAQVVSKPEKTKAEEKVPKNTVLKDVFADDIQLIDDDIKLEQEKALNSFSGKAKRVEEEKPSFKAPPNVLLKGHYSKPHIRNDLTASDNEDGESLEDFWRRAEVKLAQRMRKMKEPKVGSQIY
ncbi:uncharacterized protein [Parasteatoda tepidariorum]|uniref:uncharacterized protein isoform X2 n=1 Tax=Parasteatoda tepidariorum TaxID=114398 RepID=UPI00077FCE2E|nr:uncharacterized protein LOC107451980 isoform X2 [Parasteatoda tepidariorum]XP_015923725.1 uncharacterized protein LOC107451980 isoform X2 [Parasteatoda tepidariorum]XP_042907039.1 uncharacterized protein LOC107451980 isoform X2 [Parasteatoda tepidariorum]